MGEDGEPQPNARRRKSRRSLRDQRLEQGRDHILEQLEQARRMQTETEDVLGLRGLHEAAVRNQRQSTMGSELGLELGPDGTPHHLASALQPPSSQSSKGAAAAAAAGGRGRPPAVEVQESGEQRKQRELKKKQVSFKGRTPSEHEFELTDEEEEDEEEVSESEEWDHQAAPASSSRGEKRPTPKTAHVPYPLTLLDSPKCKTSRSAGENDTLPELESVVGPSLSSSSASGSRALKASGSSKSKKLAFKTRRSVFFDKKKLPQEEEDDDNEEEQRTPAVSEIWGCCKRRRPQQPPAEEGPPPPRAGSLTRGPPSCSPPEVTVLAPIRERANTGNSSLGSGSSGG